MKSSFVAFLLLLWGAGVPVHAASDDEVASRAVANELAGAFANDGFKLRDSFWSGRLEPHKSRLIQVNLYAGNQYWFILGASSHARKVAVLVYDEAGKPMPVEPFAEDARAAAGFAPEISGPYYIRIEQIDGAAGAFCLMYSYK